MSGGLSPIKDVLRLFLPSYFPRKKTNNDVTQPAKKPQNSAQRKQPSMRQHPPCSNVAWCKSPGRTHNSRIRSPTKDRLAKHSIKLPEIGQPSWSASRPSGKRRLDGTKICAPVFQTKVEGVTADVKQSKRLAAEKISITDVHESVEVCRKAGACPFGPPSGQAGETRTTTSVVCMPSLLTDLGPQDKMHQ